MILSLMNLFVIKVINLNHQCLSYSIKQKAINITHFINITQRSPRNNSVVQRPAKYANSVSLIAEDVMGY